MRISALMNFYDDPPETLERAIRSAAEIVDVLVAVDGAYGSFPSGEPRSPAEQVGAIQQAAADCDLDLLLYQPRDVWLGGEAQKRDFMLRLADTTKADWYTMLDSDFVFEYPYKQGAASVLTDLRVAHKRGFEVCKVLLIDYLASEDPDKRRRSETPLPLFYRAEGLPEIRIGPTHYHTWREGYEKHLWGCANTPQLEHFDMTDTMHVKHEWWHRDQQRQAQKWLYYFQRDQAGLEHNPYAPDANKLVAAAAEED